MLVNFVLFVQVMGRVSTKSIKAFGNLLPFPVNSPATQVALAYKVALAYSLPHPCHFP